MTFKRLFLVICAILKVDRPAQQTAANLPADAPLENPDPSRDCLGPALARSHRHTKKT
ncbi:hypothetical protein QUB60_08115 [Microcoleus sp. A2-C5]|uniref:hypothetical protein n=1 Tax=Microcoleaceae TaxID=1892252 RepID=UPI0022380281|nr:hypothetical protein [Lyngbya sp. CCAP 1446/10]MCW6048698.1 hypothetical protein [Lyngbya sp. CCAP 1446/10]